jgi:DNA topoisomerase I
MQLFIVESPNKFKKLREFLGNDFRLAASLGHIRQIPPESMNVDVRHGFEPRYEVLWEKQDLVNELRRLGKEATRVWLATDPDREGEQIAYSIQELLDKSSRSKCRRISFLEITRSAVQAALKKPRPIDMDLVHAQKARQVLDRLIGYKASPLLWKAVRHGTSAGRVQSVALLLLCQRQDEIDSFRPVDFWHVDARLRCAQGTFVARVVTDDKDNRFYDEGHARKAVAVLRPAHFRIGTIDRQRRQVAAHPPFDTTSLQASCSTLFGMDTTRTMQVAQRLYEAGLSTYIRTDSFAISKEALEGVRMLIRGQYGESYLPDKANRYAKKSSAAAQEAHECIRPTDCAEEGSGLAEEERDVYRLIRCRFIACQMSPMQIDAVSYHVTTGTAYRLLARGQTVFFDGWRKAYPYSRIKEELLPLAAEGEALELLGLDSSRHQTKPPDKYSDGSLAKKMEDLGVGRPSTRAPIIRAIQSKGYAEMDKKMLVPTGLGRQVCAYLMKQFADFFMDHKFTARLEQDLDGIARGEKAYGTVVQKVYGRLVEKIQSLPAEQRGHSATGEACSKCKEGEIMEKSGRYGQFYSCSNYPRCKAVFEPDGKDGFRLRQKKKATGTGASCGVCKEGEIVERESAFGKFFACNRFPQCKTVFVKRGGKFTIKEKR